jgi:hypothetical protein
VVVLDISEEQLSKRAQMIYGQLKAAPDASTESKAS